jgi:hypothetical protein
MLRPGDVIEINGTRFVLLNSSVIRDQSVSVFVDKNGYYGTSQASFSVPTVLAQPINDSGQQINPRYDNNGLELGSQAPPYKPPPPYWSNPAPYKVLRQPTPASEEPYQLPEGTAIDLRASGVGSDDYFYVQSKENAAFRIDNSDGILIMFAPEGRVSRVSYSRLPSNVDPFDKPVVDNVYLLVGRRENVPPAAADDLSLQSSAWNTATTDEQRAKLREPINWLLGSSRWIVIGSQSGRIATIDNGFVDGGGITASGTPSEGLRNSQILSAREFTREMGQLGGR